MAPVYFSSSELALGVPAGYPQQPWPPTTQQPLPSQQPFPHVDYTQVQQPRELTSVAPAGGAAPAGWRGGSGADASAPSAPPLPSVPPMTAQYAPQQPQQPYYCPSGYPSMPPPPPAPGMYYAPPPAVPYVYPPPVLGPTTVIIEERGYYSDPYMPMMGGALLGAGTGLMLGSLWW